MDASNMGLHSGCSNRIRNVKLVVGSHILDNDYKSAFDLMVAAWIIIVLEKNMFQKSIELVVFSIFKGLLLSYIERNKGQNHQTTGIS